MKKALIINAHQFVEGISAGKLNTTMVDVISEELLKKGYELKHTNIEKGYDINEEVDKHVWADLIILQSPIYWFGNPWKRHFLGQNCEKGRHPRRRLYQEESIRPNECVSQSQ